jgi:apolipoprotein D and lipocalin family protein
LKYIGLVLLVLLAGCVGVPEGITPVNNFDRDAYLGKWYEIARLDNRFEKGMSQVTATYSLNDDGSIKVLNQGYVDADKEWAKAEGKAKFVGDSSVGHLQVSFFGPFYSSYVVFELGEDYSFVTSRDRDYLWFLSRTKQVSEERKAHFIAQAKLLGFAYQDILFIDQSKHQE